MRENKIYVDVEAGSKNTNFIVGAFIAVDIKKSFNSQPIFSLDL